MSCEHCKSTIENSLKNFDGIIDTKIDLINKTITIEFLENKIGIDEIISMINELGYNVLVK